MKKIQQISNIICIVLLAAYALLIIIRWNSIPEEVPTHFTFDGTPDGYGSRSMILVNYIIAVFMFAGLDVVERFPRLWNFPVRITPHNRDREYLIAGVMLSAVKTLVIMLFLIGGLAAMFEGFPAWPVMVPVIAILAVTAGGIVMSFRCR